MVQQAPTTNDDTFGKVRAGMRSRRWTVGLAAGAALAAGLSAGALAYSAAAVPASAELLGFSGHLGEWELTATVHRQGEARALAGALTMKHVGWCGQDGPETKSGQIQVRMARLTSAIHVGVNIDGVDCNFEGRLSDAYTGHLSCPDRRPVPMTLWLR